MDHDGWNRLSREDGVGRTRQEVQNSFDMLALHGGILLDELIQGEVLQVLENRGYRHAGATKHPGSADFSGNAFENRAV